MSKEQDELYAVYRIGHAVWWSLQTEGFRKIHQKSVNRAVTKLTDALEKLEARLPKDWVERDEKGEP